MSLIDLTGCRFERIEVVRRAQDSVLSSGRKLPAWLCLCQCGTEWGVTGQNLRSGCTKSCGCLSREQMAEVGRRNRKIGQISYSAAHRRIRAAKGSARDRTCVGCDGPAAEWSYDHSDPDEWHEVHSRTGRLVAYSANPDHYAARCSTCHQAFDNGGRP